MEYAGGAAGMVRLAFGLTCPTEASKPLWSRDRRVAILSTAKSTTSGPSENG